MAEMPNDYSLQDLAKLTELTPRTIRYYIVQGLVPAPTQVGSRARYTDDHLDRLRVIKKFQAAHLPLAEIRNRLRALPDEAVSALAEDGAPDIQRSDSAIDYINSLLTPTTRHAPPAPSVPPTAAATPSEPAPMSGVTYRRMWQSPDAAAWPTGGPAEPPTKPNTEPERAQWERIALDPDIEIHIRRPLTRQQNKRVERLISIARQLLEE